MEIKGRCRNETEFEPVRFALEEAKFLTGFRSDRNTIICQNNPEAWEIIRRCAPSGLTQTGMGFI